MLGWIARTVVAVGAITSPSVLALRRPLASSTARAPAFVGSSVRVPVLALRARPLAMMARGGGKKGGGKQDSSFRNPHNLPVKTCVVCDRPFTWRKKWENCWDEVTTCSKACNAERKKANRAANHDSASEASEDASTMSESSADVELDPKAARKAAKKASKAERRAKREGTAGPTGQKSCDLCERGVDLLIRCQIDTSKQWKMVCGSCWKTPAVANGVVDGDPLVTPHYRYGGLWKNLHRAVA